MPDKATFHTHTTILRNTLSRLTVICIIATSLMAVALRVGAEPRTKKLLIINSYNESAPWVQSYITPFLLEAAKDDRLDCDVVHMNSSLIRTDSMYENIENGIFDRFSNSHPDYLVVIGKMAFSLRDRIKAEWGANIPILFLGVDDTVCPGSKYLSGDKSYPETERIPLSSLRTDYNFTFVEVPDLYKETIDMMAGMQPGMKKLVFASDELASNMELDKKIREYLSAKYPQLQYEWLIASDDSRKDLQRYLNSKDMSIGILLSSWYYARPSALGYPMLVTGDVKIISSTPHPVFSLSESYINFGAIGGYYPSQKEILENSLAAFRVMLGSGDMRRIPFSYIKEKYPTVNYTLMKSKGTIRESGCPEGTVFINKPKTLWEQYFWQIIVGGIVIVAALCVAAVFIIFQRKRILMLASSDKMVNNMPICYMTGHINKDDGGDVAGIKFTSGNCEAEKLVDTGAGGSYDNIFDQAYLNEMINNMRKTKKNIKFTHYFAQTGCYYDFVVCQTMNEDEVDLFGMDVTEKVKSEKSLKDTSRTLEMTLAVAHIIPWKWDLKKHLISCEANKIMQHLNIPKHEDSTACTHLIEDEEYFKRIHPDDRTGMRHLYNSLINGTRQYVKGEFRIISENDGKENIDWMEVNASVSKYDDSREPEELIGSLLLITARKEQEANLIAAKEAAKESDRLKSAFLANMSHEIRTPLNAIIGFSNLLATTDDEEDKQKFINIIENNNELLLQLIGDILDLAKVEANTLEFTYKPTDINALIKNIDDTVRMKVQPGVVLNHILGAADCCIETEPNRLAQVLINMLTNACKFTKEGSITFGYELHGKELFFFVRDTGCGISKEGQAQIFQRFVKLNNFVQGTGLGLPICKSIIEKMNGDIGVTSEGEGKGSTFWFTIPYIPAKIEKKAEAAEKEKKAIDHEKVTLLVAEDNESNYLLFESILGSRYKLIHAWDGVEAVELFDKHNPQLIIMDINMPKMDGYEATREIRKKSETVPIIAVTAYAFASDKENIMKSGFNSYVSKPINAKKLNDELRAVLKSHFVLL